MNYLNDYSDDRLGGGCVYCGSSDVTTRDHVPSRTLLHSPFPENLPIVPACKDCNIGFSLDEEYFSTLLECVLAGSTDPAQIRQERIARSLDRNPALRARIESARREDKDKVVFAIEDERVRNVLTKLAKGHVAYELTQTQIRPPDHIAWAPIQNMSEDAWEDFDAVHVIGLINEIGTRNAQRMMVTQLQLESDSGQPRNLNALINDWVEVQYARYRYQVIDESEVIKVKIVLAEYLACEVAWLLE
jgi:hypothetical protein